MVSAVTGRGAFPGTSHLMAYRDKETIGPLQNDEALLLFALVKTVTPKVIVEFGFHKGHSAFNFLQAVDTNTRLYSFDVDPMSKSIAEDAFYSFPNFRYFHKSQTEFDPSDVDDQLIDLVFFDAAHELEMNQETWRLVEPQLAANASILVHDTGNWCRKDFKPVHQILADASPDDWLNEDEFQHQKEEREFVNWIVTEYPDYAMVHFHSLQRIRHGLTLLQRKQLLDT